MTTIFDPIKMGELELANRIVMAPLTRCRADEGRVPNAMMAEYYVQRASAGLIISEATSVTPMGVGYPDTPGIWSNDQVRGWANVTKAIHARWRQDLSCNCGTSVAFRTPAYLNGEAPVAPSAIQPKGHVSLVRPLADYPTPTRAGNWLRSKTSSMPTALVPKMPKLPVSTAWKSTAPTVTCSTSSCKAAPTSAPTTMVVRWKTVHVCCLK
jgi:hypothetical protein